MKMKKYKMLSVVCSVLLTGCSTTKDTVSDSTEQSPAIWESSVFTVYYDKAAWTDQTPSDTGGVEGLLLTWNQAEEYASVGIFTGDDKEGTLEEIAAELAVKEDGDSYHYSDISTEESAIMGYPAWYTEWNTTYDTETDHPSKTRVYYLEAGSHIIGVTVYTPDIEEFENVLEQAQEIEIQPEDVS